MTQSHFPQLHVAMTSAPGKPVHPAQAGKGIEFMDFLIQQTLGPVVDQAHFHAVSDETLASVEPVEEETAALDVATDADLPQSPETGTADELPDFTLVAAPTQSPTPQRIAASEVVFSMTLQPRATVVAPLPNVQQPVAPIQQPGRLKMDRALPENDTGKPAPIDVNKSAPIDLKKTSISQLLQPEPRRLEMGPKETGVPSQPAPPLPTANTQPAASPTAAPVAALPFVAQLVQQTPHAKPVSTDLDLEKHEGPGKELDSTSFRSPPETTTRAVETAPRPEFIVRKPAETALDAKPQDHVEVRGEEEVFLTTKTKPSSDVAQSQALPPQSYQQAQIVRSAAAQMAVAVTQNGTGTTEIMLSPEELGKVRMLVTAQDTAITVVIHAERPETGDALRRHIETLAQEFRNMGYGSINFAFEGGKDRGADQPDLPQDIGQDGGDLAEGDAPEHAYQPDAGAGLDLRL